MDRPNTSLIVTIFNNTAHGEGLFPYGSPGNPYPIGDRLHWTGPNRDLSLTTGQFAPLAWNLIRQKFCAHYTGPLRAVYTRGDIGDLPFRGSVPHGRNRPVLITPRGMAPGSSSSLGYRSVCRSSNATDGYIEYSLGSTTGVCFLPSCRLRVRPRTTSGNWSTPVPIFHNSSGLVTWMVLPTRDKGTAGGGEPLTPLSCRSSPWENLTCQPHGRGWRLARTSPDGQWRNVSSEGSEVNATGGWFHPNVDIVPGDSFVLESTSTAYLEGAESNVTTDASAVAGSGRACL